MPPIDVWLRMVLAAASVCGGDPPDETSEFDVPSGTPCHGRVVKKIAYGLRRPALVHIQRRVQIRKLRGCGISPAFGSDPGFSKISATFSYPCCHYLFRNAPRNDFLSTCKLFHLL